MPAVKRNISHSAMVISVASGLLRASKEGKLPTDIATSIHRDIVSDFADVASFSGLQRGQSYGGYGNYSHNLPLIIGMGSGNAQEHIGVKFLIAYYHLGLDTELNLMCARICDEIQKPSYTHLLNNFYPLVQHLVTTAPPDPAKPLYNCIALNFVCKLLLVTYIVRFVGDKPPPPPLRWPRPRPNCACATCQSLFPFPISDTQTTFVVTGQVAEWPHIKQSLRGNFQYDTDRRAKPQTMTIKKFDGDWGSRQKAWDKSAKDAKMRIGALGTQNLKYWLGDDYTAITTVDVTSVKHVMINTANSVGALAPLRQSAVDQRGNRVLEPPSRRKVPQPQQVIVIDD